METKVKNREWVKDAAIVFLAVLLVLTFFSNTIMNRTLPEVATAQVTDGSIVAKVRGSGVVTANGKHQVKAKEIRTIRAVMIKAGQEVNAGDVLFVLGEGDATALEQAQEQLRNLQYSYQRSAAGIPNFDYSSYYRAINNAERNLKETEDAVDKAKKEYDLALKNESLTNTEAARRLDEATRALDNAAKALKEAEASEPEETHKTKDEEINKAVLELRELIAKNTPAIDPPSPEPSSEPSSSPSPSQVPNESGENNGNAGSGGTDGGEGGGVGGGEGGGVGGGEGGGVGGGEGGGTGSAEGDGVGSGEGGSGNGESNGTENQSTFAVTLPDTTTMPETPTTLENDEPTAEGCAYSEGKEKSGIILLATHQEAVDILSEANAAVEDLKSKLEGPVPEEVSTALNTLKSKVEDHNSYLVSTDYTTYNKAKEAYFLVLERYNAAIPASVKPYKEAWDAAKDAVTAAQEDLQYAYDSLYSAQESNSKTASLSYIDLAQQAEEIKILQEKIKSLAGDEENVITANVSGTVDTVDCTAGDTVLKDAILATIEVPDMGHTLSFSVTNDQAQRLRIGDTATISNYYWGNSITATLTTIRSDPKNPQTNKLLTFDLTGDVTTGAELTISVGQKSANYDLIVPNSAIKSDTNGSYVLAVSVKSSPLGNRYTARRVSVEVLANDDNNSAVVADLGNGDYVITTSSAPLNSGDMVRMADS